MGFAHHSRYLVYFESARTEMLRARGDSYRAWEERGVLLPLTASHIDYHKPAYYDDELEIRVRIASVNRLRLQFAYEVHCPARGTHIATGETHHVFMSPQGKPVRVGEDILARLKG